MKKEELYGWVMIYNPYRQEYMATRREYYNELWSGDQGNIVTSSNQKKLEEKIINLERKL